jgi:hypothetical protein
MDIFSQIRRGSSTMRRIHAAILAATLTLCGTSCSSRLLPAQSPTDPFSSGAPVARLAPVSPNSPDTGYESHAALYGDHAYIGGNDTLAIVDLPTATTVSTLHPRNRPLRQGTPTPPDARPVVTSSDHSPVVIWPFLVTTGATTAIELTTIHPDTQKTTQVMVSLPGSMTAAEPSLSVTTIGALGSTVVLDVSDRLTHTAMAVDATSGTPRWTRANFAAAALADATVVGTEQDSGPAQTSQLSGLSVATGQPVWTRPPGYGAQVVSAGPTLVAARQGDFATAGTPAQPRATELVAAKTGATVTPLPLILGEHLRCLYDQASVTACTSPADPRAGGRTVVAFDARTGHILWTMPSANSDRTSSGEAPFPTAAWHGHLYTTDTEKPLGPSSLTTVTNGQPAQVPLPTTPLSTSYQARTGLPDATITGPIPVLVNDHACLAINPEHTQLFARPRAPHPRA